MNSARRCRPGIGGFIIHRTGLREQERGISPEREKNVVSQLNISTLGGKLDHNAIVQSDGSQGTNRALTNAINFKEFLR